MKRSELKQLIEESYYEVLVELNSKKIVNEADEEKPDDTEDTSSADTGTDTDKKDPEPEKGPDMSAPADTVLKDATNQILAKFPTLETAIVKLQTEDFKDFVSSIDWISPRPTSFRINLKNGQSYIMKWLGKGFEAQILGKRYYIENIGDYQQALDKLAVLYREGPFPTQEEEGQAGQEADFNQPPSSGGGGGGEFPGGEGGSEETPEGGEEGGGEEAPEGGEEEHKDLSGEKIDFENPGEEPEK